MPSDDEEWTDAFEPAAREEDCRDLMVLVLRHFKGTSDSAEGP